MELVRGQYRRACRGCELQISVTASTVDRLTVGRWSILKMASELKSNYYFKYLRKLILTIEVLVRIIVLDLFQNKLSIGLIEPTPPFFPT